ncbi:hypothetical protein C8R46DRAFT_1206965 [Mycena filopes]|nr:hypothetical protein C8R46DRAFT_1206965 [Mycena filopes]
MALQVKWQQHTEEPLWLPKYSTALIFRVSAPKYDPAQGGSETRAEQSTRAPRALRDVIPSDIYTTKSLDDTSPESPSLVSQLQQVHGLTKKKVYGAKPARVPFILESERVRERYRKVPSQSPSSLPLPPETSAPPSLTRASRSHANLRADRSFSAQPARPVDPHPHPYQWQQQQQPMSSPEVDSPYSSSSLSSPPSPAVENPRFRIDSSSTRLVPEELEFYMQAFPSHEHFTDPGRASSSPRFPVPPLGSPAYLPHAPGVEGYTPAMTMEPLEFQSNRFAPRPRDTDPGGYPFPSSVAALPTYTHTGHAHAHTHTHIHAPAPSSAATASFPADDDRDNHAAHLVLSAPAPRRVPQQSTSTSIPPPSAAPAPHHRADRAAHSNSVTAAAHPSLETRSMPPPHASARSRSSSTHAPSSSSSSSAASSSLTGWAG